MRKDHPLRAVRAMTDEILERMSPLFDAMYAEGGRPSIPPEKLLRAQLLQMLYSVRSERLLMEEIDYSILYRWFVGLNLDHPVWDATTFTKNRDRLLEASVAKEFLAQVVEQARAAGLISDEHFTVDGTLLEAWASLKSFQAKDKQDTPPPDDPSNPTADFHGEKRSNETHESKTDPDALLARKGKGKEAKLSYNGNLLVENRNGLIVNAELLQANGRAERDAALLMLEQVPGDGRITVGGDKGFDTAGFVDQCRHILSDRIIKKWTTKKESAACNTVFQHPARRIQSTPMLRLQLASIANGVGARQAALLLALLLAEAKTALSRKSLPPRSLGLAVTVFQSRGGRNWILSKPKTRRDSLTVSSNPAPIAWKG